MHCGIALGSNLGDRFAHLLAARRAVARLHTGTLPPLVSSVYETEPVDCAPGDAAYLNAVMEIEIHADQPNPDQLLLRALQQIERDLGRPDVASRRQNAPRTIDLDLLYAGTATRCGEHLILPHPRMQTRRFVLQPLAEIRPALRLPGFQQTVAELLALLPAAPGVTLFPISWNHE